MSRRPGEDRRRHAAIRAEMRALRMRRKRVPVVWLAAGAIGILDLIALVATLVGI